MQKFRLALSLALVTAVATPVVAAGTAGSYLAARQATYLNDYRQAAEYFTRALVGDSGNPALMEAAISANVNLGRFDRAFPVAHRMDDLELRSQVAALVLLVEDIGEDQFTEITEAYEQGMSVGTLVDGLAVAWAHMGDGNVDEAFAAFDEVSEQRGLEIFAKYHKALALASVGDFEGADEIFSGRADGPLQVSRRGVMAHAQILSQLDRNTDARDLILATFGATPAPVFEDMLLKLEADETLSYDVATNAKEGMSEVFFSVASALANEAAPAYTLLYSRAAQFLNPVSVDATILTATLLEEVDQFDLATDAYDRVPRDHPAFVTAELGRAESLRLDDREDAAVEVLSQLSEDHADTLIVHVTLGDTLRRMERFGEATAAYDHALGLLEEQQPQHWVLLFSRGITLERTDRWDEAEADFRRALELRPDQPQVLNYLGYSLVEMQSNLDEALGMIERAVAGRPDDGYITDSLGWVLYRLGRYDEAIGHMERAAELMPVDPIINDHLGDVLWAVGRQLEAQFQWRRALSFDPEPEDAERIRRKLEVGLDVVLSEEGAEPLAVAKEG